MLGWGGLETLRVQRFGFMVFFHDSSGEFFGCLIFESEIETTGVGPLCYPQRRDKDQMS